MKKVIILLLAVLLILGSGMCGDALGNAMAEGPEETVRLTYYKSVRIRTGDTLWDLAEQYAPKQEEILEYIKDCILKKGYPPSVREICEAVSLKSTSSVHSHLESLEKNGYIHRDPTKPRTIEIIDDCFNLTRRELVNVPLVGTIAAGEPILAQERIENYFPIPVEMLPNEQAFMLRVKGESMIKAGIFDGDQIIVKQQNYARNGEIVVAMIDDGATVKRFYKENGHYRLQPENDALDPIIVDHVEVLGVVIGLFRIMQ